MFALLKFFLGLVGIAVVAASIFYFLPANLKSKTLTFVSGVVPESLHTKAEELLLTPTEQRTKLIDNIEDNVASLKAIANPKATELMQQTEALLEELKAKNAERSLAEIVKEKLVDQFLNKPAACVTP